jgi:SAM-dependent methyltransferase
LFTSSQKSEVRTNEDINERSVEYAFVFTRMAARGTGHLLDVGTGKSAFPALATMAGWRVTAVDNIVDFWRRGPLGMRWGLFNEHFAVEDRDLTRKQLPPDFDVVACISTFEHVIDRPGLFAAMSRALRPSGELLITTPYCESGGVPNAYVRPNSDAYGRSVPYICKVLDRQELDGLCRQNGMKIDVIEYWRFWGGKYWSEGQQLERGEQSTSSLPHDLACISLVHDTRLA